MGEDIMKRCERNRAYYAANAEKLREKRRQRYAADPEKYRAINLRSARNRRAQIADAAMNIYLNNQSKGSTE